MPPGDSGTGRLVSFLLSNLGSDKAEVKVSWIIKPDETAPVRHAGDILINRQIQRFYTLRYSLQLTSFWLKILFVLSRRNRRVLIIHPQSIGCDLTLRIMSTRAVPSYLYLLDSSYFCPVSYNHIKGENTPCLRCQGGSFSQVQAHDCKPFPRWGKDAYRYAPELSKLVAEGKVVLLAQTKTQAEQAKDHFRLDHLPDIVGLWASDWEDSFTYFYRKVNVVESGPYEWDVVFHANCLRAKGFLWMISVAKSCPLLRFMFPFTRPSWAETPSNCSFIPCTWDTGLKDHLVKSRFVAVPSIWSAPIESALIKSIAMARAVIVVKNQTGYMKELPENLILKLPPDPLEASHELVAAINKGWSPDYSTRKNWLDKFVAEQKLFSDRLTRSITKTS